MKAPGINDFTDELFKNDINSVEAFSGKGKGRDLSQFTLWQHNYSVTRTAGRHFKISQL